MGIVVSGLLIGSYYMSMGLGMGRMERAIGYEIAIGAASSKDALVWVSDWSV